MSAGEAATRVDEILRVDLSSLTEYGRLSVFPSEVVRRWGLSDRDERVLESYGLPPTRQDGLLNVSAAFQVLADPSLEGDLFEIGAYGVSKLGLSKLDDSVRAVSPYRMADIHPQLRAMYSDKERAQMANSTLPVFVEFSWRWHWILPILAEQQIAARNEEVQAWSAARTDAERSALPDFYAGVRALCQKVLGEIEIADPRVPQVEGAFWRTVIMEYL